MAGDGVRGLLLEFPGKVLTEFDRFFQRHFSFGVLDWPISKGKSAHMKLLTNYFRIRSNRTLTSTTHRSEESALSGNALERVVMVEALAERRDSLILLPDFDTDRALSDTGQHYVRIQNRRQQPVRHSIALK